MTNVFGTNLVTVDGDDITTGQKDIRTAGATPAGPTQLTTSTGPLTHGIFVVTKDAGPFYLGNSSVTITTGVTLSANNPVFIPVKDPSAIYAATAVDEDTLSFIMY